MELNPRLGRQKSDENGKYHAKNNGCIGKLREIQKYASTRDKFHVIIESEGRKRNETKF